MSATLGQQMFAAAMGEAHRHVAQGYLGIEMRDLSEDQLGVAEVEGRAWGGDCRIWTMTDRRARPECGCTM